MIRLDALRQRWRAAPYFLAVSSRLRRIAQRVGFSPLCLAIRVVADPHGRRSLRRDGAAARSVPLQTAATTATTGRILSRRMVDTDCFTAFNYSNTDRVELGLNVSSPPVLIRRNMTWTAAPALTYSFGSVTTELAKRCRMQSWQCCECGLGTLRLPGLIIDRS
jgi:hypothetical protein